MTNMNRKPGFHPSRPRPSQRGTATIELAILAVPLLMLVFGVVEYGRAIYQYNTLVKSVRNAARYLTAETPGHGHIEAKNLAVCGYIDCADVDADPLVPGLTTSMVRICDATTIADCPGEEHSGVATGTPSSPVGTVNLVTVKITQPDNINVGYRFQPIFSSFMLGLVGGQVSIGAPSMAFDPIKITMRQPL